MWGSLLAKEYTEIVSSANEKLLQVHLAFKIMTVEAEDEKPLHHKLERFVFSLDCCVSSLKLAQKLLIF